MICECKKECGNGTVQFSSTEPKGSLSHLKWKCPKCLENFPAIKDVYVKDLNGNVAFAEFTNGYFNVAQDSHAYGAPRLIRTIVPINRVFKWAIRKRLEPTT